MGCFCTPFEIARDPKRNFATDETRSDNPVCARRPSTNAVLCYYRAGGDRCGRRRAVTGRSFLRVLADNGATAYAVDGSGCGGGVAEQRRSRTAGGRDVLADAAGRVGRVGRGEDHVAGLVRRTGRHR